MKTKPEKEISFLKEEEVTKRLKESNLYDKYEQMRNMGKELFMNFCTGKSMKALTYDAIFKKIFRYEEHPGRLESFLTAILGFEVKILNILPIENNKMIESGSVLIMDMVVKAYDGSIINVEMQKRPYEFTGQRDSCYISDMIMRQYNELKGRARQEDKPFNYKEMKPVYTIIFIEKAYYDMLNYPDKWEHNGRICFDSGLNIRFLENIKYIVLDNFYKTTQNIDTEKEKWVYLLGADTTEKVMKAAAFSEEFFQIISDVAMFTMDVERVMNMFSEALYMLDRNTEKLMYDEAINELEKLKEDRKKIETEIERMREEKKQAEEEKQRAEIDKQIYRCLLLGDDISEIAKKLNVSVEYVTELKNS